jgi:hypothetical protein
LLAVSETQVTDQGLQHLARLTRLEKLDLSDTKITDPGLVHLAGLTELRELNLLQSHGIKGDGLKYLANLKKLEQLLLPSNVNATAIAHLKSALPVLEIHQNP